VLVLTGASAFAAHVIARSGSPARIVLAASSLAGRSLLAAVARVHAALSAGDPIAARSALRHVVGRDVDDLDAPEIARAALEALAESLGDGVAAPLLALVAGGCTAALAFKAISTLDSMIGHREAPYTWFGLVAARTDDAANLIPSRLAALAIALAAGLTGDDPGGALRVALHDARRHASPNAGWPEAALAGALGVRLGGANRYDGVLVDGAVFHATGRAPDAADVGRGMCLVAAAIALLEGAATAAPRP
jgi:adenosylcobinamide-phosphate synthase